jgi:hypothetical protein
MDVGSSYGCDPEAAMQDRIALHKDLAIALAKIEALESRFNALAGFIAAIISVLIGHMVLQSH